MIKWLQHGLTNVYSTDTWISSWQTSPTRSLAQDIRDAPPPFLDMPLLLVHKFWIKPVLFSLAGIDLFNWLLTKDCLYSQTVFSNF